MHLNRQAIFNKVLPPFLSLLLFGRIVAFGPIIQPIRSKYKVHNNGDHVEAANKNKLNKNQTETSINISDLINQILFLVGLATGVSGFAGIIALLLIPFSDEEYLNTTISYRYCLLILREAQNQAKSEN